MSNYAIMRVEKLKSRVSLVGALRHNTREKMPKNADPELSQTNFINHTMAESLDLYTKLLPKKVRKNAVHAVEVVMTASADWFEKASKEKKKEFYKGAGEWVNKLFGKKNVISVTIHMDEKTPHFHVIAVPLVDGKLNAKKLIGGTKYRMRDLQNDFYEKVGRPLGMDRGIERDKPVRHRRPKEFASVMAEKEKELAHREEVVKLAEKLNEKTLRQAVAERLVGLDQKGMNECWAAMKSKADEIRSARFQKVENSNEQKKGHTH